MLPPPPFPVGTKTTGALPGTTKLLHSSDLGKVFAADGKEYMLVQASTTQAAPASKAFIQVPSSNVFGGVVDVGATNNDAYAIGVAPSNQVALTAGDFFLLQVAGPAVVISDAAFADRAPIGIGGTTAGRVSGTTITFAGCMGYAVGTAAGAGTNQNVMLIRRC